MHLAPNNSQIWLAVMIAVSAYAFMRGGRPERMVAIANIVAYLATIAVQNRQDWFHPQWSMLAVDVAFLALLVGMALMVDRYWLLFASAFQLLGVVTHLAIIADPSVRSLAYLRSLGIWGYMVLVALAVGAYGVARRPGGVASPPGAHA
jgi:hypothetical protein